MSRRLIGSSAEDVFAPPGLYMRTDTRATPLHSPRPSHRHDWLTLASILPSTMHLSVNNLRPPQAGAHPLAAQLHLASATRQPTTHAAHQSAQWANEQPAEVTLPVLDLRPSIGDEHAASSTATSVLKLRCGRRTACKRALLLLGDHSIETPATASHHPCAEPRY